jgi:hypothetical protein
MRARRVHVTTEESTFDYIIELVDHPAHYFFVQVKGTTKGYTKNPVRLILQVNQNDIDRMVRCPAPTYVAGIDVTTRDLGYLLSVNEPRAHIASLTTKFKIDRDVLRELHDEVHMYWSSRNMILTGSRFRE